MKIRIIRFAGAMALSIALVGCALLTAPRGPSAPAGGYVPKEPVFEHNKGAFTDQRDGKTYETVVIGSQTWLAENLNYEAEGGKCYGNSESNCQKYGKLYDWLTAMALPSKCQGLNLKPDFGPGFPGSNEIQVSKEIDADCVVGNHHQGVCPSGWHLPSDAEWQTLVSFAGGEKSAGTRLKASSDWGNFRGSDSYGFKAMSGGQGRPDGSFGGIGAGGFWLTSTGGDYVVGSGNLAYSRAMAGSGYSYYEVGQRTSDAIGFFYSVRCVQN